MNRKIVKAVALLPLIYGGVQLGLFLEQRKRDAPILSSFSSVRPNLLHESGRATAHAVVTSALASRLAPATHPEFVDTRNGGMKQRDLSANLSTKTEPSPIPVATFDLEGIAAVRLKSDPDKPVWVIWSTEQEGNVKKQIWRVRTLEISNLESGDGGKGRRILRLEYPR